MKLKDLLYANSDLWFLIQLFSLCIIIILSGASYFFPSITDPQILKVCYVWMALGIIQIGIGIWNDWGDRHGY